METINEENDPKIINGVVIQMTTDELREYLQKRVAARRQRVPRKTMSEDPGVRRIQEMADQGDVICADRLETIAAYLIPDRIYRLTSKELSQLE